MRLLLFASMLLFAAPAMAGPDDSDGGVTAVPDSSPERLVSQADQAFEVTLDAIAIEAAAPVAALGIAPDLAEAAVRPYAASSRAPDREEGRPGYRAAWRDQGRLVARLPSDPVSPRWTKVNDPTLVDVGK